MSKTQDGHRAKGKGGPPSGVHKAKEVGDVEILVMGDQHVHHHHGESVTTQREKSASGQQDAKPLADGLEDLFTKANQVCRRLRFMAQLSQLMPRGETVQLEGDDLYAVLADSAEHCDGLCSAIDTLIDQAMRQEQQLRAQGAGAPR